MEKINFSNGEKISAAKVTIENVDYEVTPAVYDGATPLNATVFNNMQNNIENAINTKADSEDVYEKTETYTKIEVDNLIPTKAHQINVGEDTDYRVNLLHSENLFDKKTIVAGDVKGDNSSIRLSSRQVQYIEAGTYTISSDLPLDTYNYGFQILETPPPRANYDALYNTSWLNVSSYTFTTSVNGYMIVNVRKSDNSSLSVSEIANYNFYLTKGSTATTDDFIPNQINVDNEKYSDTINVGATEDSRSRVNVLKSKNLLDFNNISSYSSTNVTATPSYTDGKLNYINVTKSASQSSNEFITLTTFVFDKPTGDYTLNGCPSGGGNSTYALYFKDNTTNTDISPRDIGEGATVTLTNDHTYILYLRMANTAVFSDKKFYPMLRKATDTNDTYEPYIVPSIKVDNEEIYRKPKVLWENPNITTNIAAQTLLTNMNEYEYYEIIYKMHKTLNDFYMSTGKIQVGKNTRATQFYPASNRLQLFNREFTCTSTTLSIGDGYYYYADSSSTATANDMIMPYKIIGY